MVTQFILFKALENYIYIWTFRHIETANLHAEKYNVYTVSNLSVDFNEGSEFRYKSAKTNESNQS